MSLETKSFFVFQQFNGETWEDVFQDLSESEINRIIEFEIGQGTSSRLRKIRRIVIDIDDSFQSPIPMMQAGGKKELVVLQLNSISFLHLPDESGDTPICLGQESYFNYDRKVGYPTCPKCVEIGKEKGIL